MGPMQVEGEEATLWSLLEFSTPQYKGAFCLHSSNKNEDII